MTATCEAGRAEYEGRDVRICHVKGTVRRAYDRAYSVEVEIGGVIQRIVVEAGYVHDQLDD